MNFTEFFTTATKHETGLRLRIEFVAAAPAVCGCQVETILWNTVNLRKRKTLPSVLKRPEVMPQERSQ
jgi:hypothetical protein